ncbi:MAG: cyclic nucleotide-binding domain-containing protein [Alphaproteobacteria bacterium]|nr:cyclic nucleotide-binding domain-containing protein [Alphaproteobacteria bacterium]
MGRNKAAAGKVILDQFSASSNVYFILSGLARVVNHSSSGREIAYADLTKGSYFGGFLAMLDGPSHGRHYCH